MHALRLPPYCLPDELFIKIMRYLPVKQLISQLQPFDHDFDEINPSFPAVASAPEQWSHSLTSPLTSALISSKPDFIFQDPDYLRQVLRNRSARINLLDILGSTVYNVVATPLAALHFYSSNLAYLVMFQRLDLLKVLWLYGGNEIVNLFLDPESKLVYMAALFGYIEELDFLIRVAGWHMFTFNYTGSAIQSNALRHACRAGNLECCIYLWKNVPESCDVENVLSASANSGNLDLW